MSLWAYFWFSNSNSEYNSPFFAWDEGILPYYCYSHHVGTGNFHTIAKKQVFTNVGLGCKKSLNQVILQFLRLNGEIGS